MAISGIEIMHPDFSNKVSGKSKSYPAKNAKEDSFKAVFEEIKKKGLVKYVEDKRTEELREKILGAMGLSEEALKEMPPEQRMKVEQRISEEMMKRLAAEKEMNKGGDKSGGGLRQPFSCPSFFLT